MSNFCKIIALVLLWSATVAFALVTVGTFIGPLAALYYAGLGSWMIWDKESFERHMEGDYQDIEPDDLSE